MGWILIVIIGTIIGIIAAFVMYRKCDFFYNEDVAFTIIGCFFISLCLAFGVYVIGNISANAYGVIDTYEVKVSLSDVPSDCAIKDRIINREGKYTVIDDFLTDHPELKEVVMKNQDYFDVINMADKIKASVIASVGSIDNICPPKYFMKAYELIKSEKHLDIYDGYGHGGFEEIHLPKKIEFAKKVLKCDY